MIDSSSDESSIAPALAELAAKHAGDGQKVQFFQVTA